MPPLLLCFGFRDILDNVYCFYAGPLQDNLNSKSYLSTIKMQVFENLRKIQHAPSVQMHEVRIILTPFATVDPYDTI